MKTIITIVLILLAGFTLTSCDETNSTEFFAPPPGPDPVAVLEEKIEAERQLREKAEALASEQAASKDNWQLASLGLGLFAVVALFGGTSIGTRGRHPASTREGPPPGN